MAPELSSNWKTLQATLKQDPQTKPNQKRKAEPSEREQNTLAKRRRLEAKQPKSSLKPSNGGKGRGMGNWISSASTESTSQEQVEPAPSASLALWAEDNDISAQDLAEAYGRGIKETNVLGSKSNNENGGLSQDVEIGKYIGMDCEMVGVGEEARSVLARVSMVNFHGLQVYDSFVRPKEFVTDWRTHVSGVSPKNMPTARTFEEVQLEVANILKDRILVGHDVRHDLGVLLLSHPKRDIRDTAKFSGFKQYATGRKPSLKKLAKELLGVDIQGGEHSSIEDARATILLLRRHKQAFEAEHALHFPARTPIAPTEKSKSKPKSKKKRKKR